MNSSLHPYCVKCGWRKGGPDSWNGVACKCGHSEPPIKWVMEEELQKNREFHATHDASGKKVIGSSE